MSIFSPLDPATLIGMSLAATALTASACPPLTPKEDVVQNSAQSSAEDTGQNASQIGNHRIIPLSGVDPDTLGELYELLLETKAIPNDVLLRKLTREAEDTETMSITPKEYFRNAAETVRVNDEAARGAVEGTTGDAPAQPY